MTGSSGVGSSLYGILARKQRRQGDEASGPASAPPVVTKKTLERLLLHRRLQTQPAPRFTPGNNERHREILAAFSFSSGVWEGRAVRGVRGAPPGNVQSSLTGLLKPSPASDSVEVASTSQVRRIWLQPAPAV